MDWEFGFGFGRRACERMRPTCGASATSRRPCDSTLRERTSWCVISSGADPLTRSRAASLSRLVTAKLDPRRSLWRRACCKPRRTRLRGIP